MQPPYGVKSQVEYGLTSGAKLRFSGS